MSEGLWAAIGAVFGGAGLAIVNKLLGKNKEKFDLSAAIRDELRKDNIDYRKEIDDLKDNMLELEKEISRLRRLLIYHGIDYNEIINPERK